MPHFIASLQHVHHELDLLGPKIVPVTLSKYRMLCAALICLACLCAAAADLLHMRNSAGVLWLAVTGLLFVAFRADGMLWRPQVAVILAGAAIGLAILAVLSAFWHEFQQYLRRVRRERRKYRRVPGTFGAPLPGTGPRPTSHSSRY